MAFVVGEITASGESGLPVRITWFLSSKEAEKEEKAPAPGNIGDAGEEK